MILASKAYTYSIHYVIHITSEIQNLEKFFIAIYKTHRVY